MADPTLDGTMLILLGDGADPEVFAFPCGANARSVTYTNNTGEAVVLDCDNPNGEQAVIKRWVESQDTQLSISGKLAQEAFDMWRRWADAEDNDGVKNIRVVTFNSAAEGGGYHEVPAILQSFEKSREGKATTDVSATIVSAGRRVWTQAA